MTFVLLAAALAAPAAPHPSLAVSAGERQQIAEAFRSRWRRNYETVRRDHPDWPAEAMTLTRVDVGACSGELNGGYSMPGCMLGLTLRRPSGETESAQVGWRFVRTEKGEWMDPVVFYDGRYSVKR